MHLDPEEPDPIPPPEEDDDEPAAAAKPRTGSAQGSFLAAAMLAVGDILEPEKTVVEIEQTNDDPVDDPPFELDFGDLPPLT